MPAGAVKKECPGAGLTYASAKHQIILSAKKYDAMNMKKLLGWEKLQQRLRHIDDDPEKVARGFALGIFIGMTPFIGLQVFIAVGLASWLRWNRLAAGIGVFNTNPITAPFLFGLAFVIGQQLTGVHAVVSFDSPAQFLALFSDGYNVLLALILGGTILGTAMALPAYYLSLAAMRRWRA